MEKKISKAIKVIFRSTILGVFYFFSSQGGCQGFFFVLFLTASLREIFIMDLGLC